jgi:hypothetical protein
MASGRGRAASGAGSPKVRSKLSSGLNCNRWLVCGASAAVRTTAPPFPLLGQALTALLAAVACGGLRRLSRPHIKPLISLACGVLRQCCGVDLPYPPIARGRARACALPRLLATIGCNRHRPSLLSPYPQRAAVHERRTLGLPPAHPRRASDRLSSVPCAHCLAMSWFCTAISVGTMGV